MVKNDDFLIDELTDAAQFELRAIFDKSSRDPQRIFQTLSELIGSLQELDKILLQAVDPKFEVELLLDDVEIGSIRTILKTFIKSLPDEGLLNLDYKRILGQYLVNCKYVLLKWLDGKYEVNGRSDLNTVIADLFKEAEKVKVTAIPAPATVQAQPLVKTIHRIHNSLKYLHPGDTVEFISEKGVVQFNKNLQIEDINKLLVEQSESYPSILILKVKMPDYLGDKMWDFKFDGHVIQVKIIDFVWLQEFQQGNIDLKPGDSLKAEVNITVDYSFEKEVLNKYYTLTRVINVIHQVKDRQQKLL